MDRGEIEKLYISQGMQPVGIDEVGRGCIAGPVFASAVVLDYEKLFQLPTSTLALIRDSKKLSSKQREQVIPTIESISRGFSTASASVAEIDLLGISKATFLAMTRALKLLDPVEYQAILIDGNQKIPLEMLEHRFNVTQAAIVKGDHWCYAIAASSIFAKEARDAFMRQVSAALPNYGFAKNVGYGTPDHISRVKQYGPTQWHRTSFEPIRSMLAQQ